MELRKIVILLVDLVRVFFFPLFFFPFFPSSPLSKSDFILSLKRCSFGIPRSPLSSQDSLIFTRVPTSAFAYLFHEPDCPVLYSLAILYFFSITFLHYFLISTLFPFSTNPIQFPKMAWQSPSQ
jgi:hypothetical protein